MQDIANYQKIREAAENYYKKIGCMNCSVFNNEKVYFNYYHETKIISHAKGDLSSD